MSVNPELRKQFQFHKGTIKTGDSAVSENTDKISIP